MGGLFGRPETPAPQTIPGFEFLPQLLQQLGGQAGQQFGNIFGDPSAPGLEGLLGAQGDALSSITGNLGLLGTQGTGTFLTGLESGFFPDIMGQVEAGLRPQLERSFQRGSEDIREQAANLGVLNSTGTVQNAQDFRGQLESGLLSNLSGIQGQLGQNAQNIRGQLASQAVGLPASILSALTPALGQALGQSQFASSLPLQAVNAISGGASATPLFQQTFGPSKFESMIDRYIHYH